MPRPRLDHVRKAQILSAAAGVLSERGYANSRVVDIAKAAGTSPAAILYWFDGKDGLLAEALRLREVVNAQVTAPDVILSYLASHTDRSEEHTSELQSQ